MPQQTNERHGIFVLPPVTRSAALSAADKRWLSRGEIDIGSGGFALFRAVLSKIGYEAPPAGLAALRYWGQTGSRPGGWIAAADPVSLEARLNHVVLHTVREAQLPLADLRGFFDLLQRELCDGKSLAFARIGRYGYIRSEQPIATASQPAETVDGQAPEAIMPSGEDVRSHHRLLGEIQMSLHEHSINARRETEGLRPINSLWLWGGGFAPEPRARPIPALFSNEPLLRGFWRSCVGVTGRWSQDLSRYLDLIEGSFVAVAPHTDCADTLVSTAVAQLRQLQAAGRFSRISLLFRDGLRVELQPRDRLRFWRGVAPVFDGSETE